MTEEKIKILDESPITPPKNLKAAFGVYPFTGPTQLTDLNLKGLGKKPKKYVGILADKIPNFDINDFLINIVYKTESRFIDFKENSAPKAAVPIINALFGSFENGKKQSWNLLHKKEFYSYFDLIYDLKDYAEEVLNGKFGKEFYNNIVRQYKFEPEPNTEFEDKLMDVFRRWYHDASSMAASQINGVFDLLKKARLKWPSMFKPHVNDGVPLFRGMSNIPSGVVNVLKKAPMDDFKRVDFVSLGYGAGLSYYVYKTPIKYKPKMDAQSWTDNVHVALKFSRDSILVTKCNTEFIMNNKFSKIWGFDEDEIIHVGKDYKEKVYLAVNENFFKKNSRVDPSQRLKSSGTLKKVANKLVTGKSNKKK